MSDDRDAPRFKSNTDRPYKPPEQKSRPNAIPRGVVYAPPLASRSGPSLGPGGSQGPGGGSPTPPPPGPDPSGPSGPSDGLKTPTQEFNGAAAKREARAQAVFNKMAKDRERDRGR